MILHGPDLRDDESCALDVVDTQLCTQNGIIFKKDYFSIQSLILTIKRVIKKDIIRSHDVIEYHSWARLVIFQFIQRVVKIVIQETMN